MRCSQSFITCSKKTKKEHYFTPTTLNSTASKNDHDNNSSVQSSHFIFSFPILKLKCGASREGEGSTPFTLCDGSGTETQKSCGVVYLQGIGSSGAHRHFVNLRQGSPKMAEVLPPCKRRQESSGTGVTLSLLRRAVKTYNAFTTRF